MRAPSPALERTACILCSERIADGEPFMTALASRGAQLENVPFHLACHTRSIAQLVVDALAPHLASRTEDTDQVAAVVSEIIARMG